MKNISILFICLGNICRSPMAEMIMRHLTENAGLQDKIQVASAGTASWHRGESMHCATQDVLQKHNIKISPFTARAIADDALQHFDYIAVMDNQNLSDVEKILGKNPQRIFKLTNFISDTDFVPDPWYDGRFEEVYDIIYRSCVAWLDSLQKSLQ